MSLAKQKYNSISVLVLLSAQNLAVQTRFVFQATERKVNVVKAMQMFKLQIRQSRTTVAE